jgi:hypothetical protein
MIPITLAALVTLGTQIATPPTDEQVLAALPKSDALRINVTISKNPSKYLRAQKDAERPVMNQWECVVYYTEVVEDVQIRRVQVMYLETARK